MNARLSFHVPLCTLTALLALCTGFDAAAQSVSTTPVGAMTVTLSGGVSGGRSLTVLSIPLEAESTDTTKGALAGKFTGISATAFSDSHASWTAGWFSQSAIPYYIRILTGSAKGRVFLLSTGTPNTNDTLTIDASESSKTDLTTLGIQVGISGDSYQIVPADTILSLFGTPATTGILDASTANSADNLMMYSSISGWTSYYYNTTSGWLRVGPPIPSGNVPVMPNSIVLYSRLGSTNLPLSIVGRVPSIQRANLIGNNGVTTLASWPTDTTLAATGIQNLPGWQKTSSASTSDTVQIYTAGNGWREFYHNGTSWIRVGPPIPSDAEPIAAGSGLLIVKKGSTAGYVALTQTLPYSL